MVHPEVSFFLALALLLIIFVLSPTLMTLRFIDATPNRLLSTDTITFPALKRFITFIQLGVSVFLIIASVVVKRQINYSLIKEPGQNHDQIVYVSAPDGITNEGISTMRNGWRKYNPNILDVIALSQLPDRIGSKEVNSEFYQVAVDPGFRDFFNLQMEEGRWFDPNASDSTFIVNQAAKEKLKANPALSSGVIQDINGIFNQPEKPIKIKRGRDYGYHWLCIRVLEVDIRRTVQKLSEDFSATDKVANVQYLNDHFKTWIVYQDKLNKLSGILTVIAGLLSCCAIYALSVSLVRDKLKQIALHQIFGATTSNVAMLLIKDFVKQLVMALLVCLPLSYILLKELLRTFTYATHLTWLDPVFPMAYCIMVIISVCGFQAWNLKRTNSITVLKG
jgi:putative ABC transport system permease protein